MEIDFLVPVARHNLFAALHGTMSVDVWDAPARSTSLSNRKCTRQVAGWFSVRQMLCTLEA